MFAKMMNIALVLTSLSCIAGKFDTSAHVSS